MMAGYRPKSLDELNSIFDKTIAAEKAIKKGSSLLEKGEDVFASFSADISSEEEMPAVPQEKQSEEIGDSVSEFIAKFSAQTEPAKAKPQMTVISSEPVRRDFEISSDEPVQEAEAAQREQEKPSRDELMDEYMRIMSDEDDDFFSEKKLSRKEKKRLRKKEKSEKEEAVAEEATEAQEGEEEIPFDSAAEYEIAEQEPAFVEREQQEASAEEKDDFDFPENYTPEWIAEEEEESAVAEEQPEKKKSKGAGTTIKVILSLVLVAVIGVAAMATVLKTVVAVNTGKLVSDKYYIFTAYKDYTDLGINEGDLVITEKKYAEEGEAFAYVDYGAKAFEFGKRTDTITKEDGEVLYITEKDGGRSLVSRDDCKGVVYLTYEGYGKAVSFLTDNYIVIVAATVVISLIIVLLFTLVLRTKKEEAWEEDKNEESPSEEGEDEFEDIFSTIG